MLGGKKGEANEQKGFLTRDRSLIKTRKGNPRKKDDAQCKQEQLPERKRRLGEFSQVVRITPRGKGGDRARRFEKSNPFRGICLDHLHLEGQLKHITGPETSQ